MEATMPIQSGRIERKHRQNLRRWFEKAVFVVGQLLDYSYC